MSLVTKNDGVKKVLFWTECHDIGFDEGFQRGIELGLEQGLERGLEKGLERGIQQERERTRQRAIQSVERSFRRRFGLDLPAGSQAAVSILASDPLDELRDALPGFTDPSALDAWLAENPSIFQSKDEPEGGWASRRLGRAPFSVRSR